MKPRGRFISEAVCPKCGSIDRTQVDIETGLRRWCIDCDFDETLADTAPVPTDDDYEDQEQALFLQPLGPGKETK